MTRLRLRAKVNFPATVTGTGGIGVSKESGVWLIEPTWDDLDLIDTLSTPETKELWVKDPATNVYYRMAVDALIDALPAGPTGPSGPGSGIRQAYSATTTDADPGAGTFRFNNATPASATAAYLDNVDASGATVSGIFDLWDDSGSTVKGAIRWEKASDPTVWAQFQVTGSVVDGTGYRKLTLANGSGSGAFTAADVFAITFFRSGDPGAIGGTTGATDNRLLRADGAGGATVQSSAVAVDDSGNITGAGTIDVGNADTTVSRSAAGLLAVEGVAVAMAGKQTIFVPASAMIPRITNGPSIGSVELTTNKVMVRSLDFDTTTQEFAQFSVWFPKSWNLGTVTFQPCFSQLTTAAGGVVFGLAGLAVSDGDDLDAAFGTAQTSTKTAGTLNKEYQGPESSAITIAGTPAAGDRILFQINRTVADASDTLAQDARLHGVRLFFTTSSANDA